MRDIHNNIATVQTLDPAVTTISRYGAPVDRRGFAAVEHIVCIGTTGETLSPALSIACAIEVSENGGDWQPVTAAHEVLGGTPDENGVFATIDDVAGDQRDYRIGYVGPARYSRVAVVLTGTHEEGTPIAALALLAHAHLKPV
ncbi:MAG: hypothetical protein Q7V31_06260 [Parvibaculum sp.]|uniref:hypothetical protein n=1 Tax=Parvibaculum sp. TaxID=2024848 RepID=UPI00271C7EE3|nr:hypothetical protein [Parvibaculum sp.]MDO8838515.1 hypothetical protein [Parvibaculum sp.]